MGDIRPVHRELAVEKSMSDVRQALVDRMLTLKGKLVRSDGSYIECNFGSLLKSRFLGEFWVSKSTLPKKATVQLEAAGDSVTKLVLDVRHTHKYGFTWGYVQKYELALAELADSLLQGI